VDEVVIRMDAALRTVSERQQSTHSGLLATSYIRNDLKIKNDPIESDDATII